MNNSATTRVGKWNIGVCNDDDNHLTIIITNDDGTKIHDTDTDLSGEDYLGFRLTTDKIEEDYEKENHA